MKDIIKNFESLDFNTFGQNMKKCRKENNLTQKGLAKEIGRSREWVIRVECGKIIPEFRDVVNICNIFNVEPNYLFGRAAYKKDIYKIIGAYLGLSENATRALAILKNEPKVSHFIETLFTEEEEDEITGKKDIVPSVFLLDLIELCSCNYGPSIMGTMIEFNDVYSKRHSELLLTREFFDVKKQRLIGSLENYINEQRAQSHLPIYSKE